MRKRLITIILLQLLLILPCSAFSAQQMINHGEGTYWGTTGTSGQKPTYQQIDENFKELYDREDFTLWDKDYNDLINKPTATDITIKTSDYTFTVTDGTILVDGSSNTVTIELLPAADVTKSVFTIKCIDDTFNVDISTNGSEEIDGNSDNINLYKHEVIRVQSDGSNYWII